ncbi:MAG: glycoside hydrolase family 32 protein [Bacteroidota bacterium]|nr:glycoside hydrolase family 32 protein [Flavisolibacter sp.]MDQ3843698.1 glycoside hydrolase family 32 protein [Bacteroidota bacterium]
MKIKYLIAIGFLVASANVKSQNNQPTFYDEPHRPQIHFSPKEKWMNDPNGMVYYKDVYHLFYQYYPGGTVWGPMHWGHATSKDLVHWQELPIALYPDSLGYIFSGSAVVDVNNTAGFGKDGKVPLIAIFTHHDPKGEKAGKNDFQYQSIAYSLDEGKTWTTYAGNPVVKNPGIRDFRDPKVTWHEQTKKWIMTLATKDRVTFYSSPNLKDWTKESEFGEKVGAHGGVWECPDLISLDYKGEKVWVLFVSINPGGPNGGSATQYFTGKFDGKTFTPSQTDTRWVDYGPDNYAGVTWANTGKRKIFLGWMSNWQYATRVPTERWRSAMTVPRDLTIEKVGERYLLTSKPSPEIKALESKVKTINNILVENFDLTSRTGKVTGPVRLDFTSDKLESFSITLSNSKGQKVVLGYDKQTNNYFIDRTASGKVNFEKGFAAKHTAPRLLNIGAVDVSLIIDNASVELFADKGLSVMTQIFFPDENFSDITIQSGDNFKIKSLRFAELKSIYKSDIVASH